jgi:hypothetical protein
MKIIFAALILLISNTAFSNVEDSFNYLLKENNVFNEEYKERYHNYYNQDIQKDSEHWHGDYSYMIYEKQEKNMFEHPIQEQCDIVILSYNESIKEMEQGVDSFSIICFYKGAVVSNINFPTESLDFFGFEFSFVQINKTSRIFYRPEIDKKENRFMTSQIRKIIIEDIEKAFKYANKDHENELAKKQALQAFYDRLNPSN